MGPATVMKFEHRKIHFCKPKKIISNVLLCTDLWIQALLYHSIHSAIITKIDITRYIPRGAPIKFQNFFILKNVDRLFRFSKNVVVSVGQVCFGVVWANCVLFWFSFALLFAFLFATHFSLEFIFCTALIALLLVLQSPI